jgi:hypothetical protein
MTATFLVAFPSFADQPPSKTTKCWLFEQKSKFVGDCKIYASAKAIKVVSANKKWIDIAKAPKWDLYFLGPGAYLYYRWELKKWNGHPLMTVVSTVNKDLKPVRTIEERKIAGLMTVKYVATGKNATHGRLDGAEFWVCRNLNLPEPVIHVMSGNMGMPVLDGVPLRVIATLPYEGAKVVLDTTGAQMVDVPDNFFSIPPGYKLAKTPEDVMMGGMTESIEDLVK